MGPGDTPARTSTGSPSPPAVRGVGRALVREFATRGRRFQPSTFFTLPQRERRSRWPQRGHRRLQTDEAIT